MNIFKNIIKRLKNKEKAEEKLKDITDKLAIKLVDDISCINGESFEKWTEDAKKDPSLNAIFEVSEFDKQLKKITTREEAILFLEERKKIDHKEYTKMFITRSIMTLKKEKYTKLDIKFLIAQFEMSNLPIPNFKEITKEEKEKLVQVLEDKLKLRRERRIKDSFEFNLKTWELNH